MSSDRRIDMLARVEGHGSVELVRDGEVVVDTRFNLNESPRLFEALLVGRRFDEIADIACRICSICSTVHKVAALQAVEQAMGIAISRQTSLLRELAVQGGLIESHALHIFLLALPDYLGMNGIQDLAAHEPDMMQLGLKIKRLGNLIQEVVGGRAIHPFNLLVGGVGKVPETEQLKSLSEQLVATTDDVVANESGLLCPNEMLPALPLTSFCAVSGGSPLFGDHLTTSTGMTVPALSAAEWLNERVEPHNNAKVCYFDGAVPFVVGPLARVMLSMPPEYKACFSDVSIRSIFKARVVELQQAMGRAQNTIELLLHTGLKKEVTSFGQSRRGNGVALIEAPRGVLLHSYRFDDHGICEAADIITPTEINQRAIAVSLKNLITEMDGADYDQIKTAAEILIRAYDPCISCAVH